MRLGLLLVAHPEGIATIWPASGLGLGILLLSPKHKWWKLLAVIFATNAAGNWSGGNSITVSLGFALANTVEPLLCAWVLIYLCKSKILFNRTVEIFALFGVATLCNGVTALLGAMVPALAFGAPFLSTWMLWWTSDGLGIILITPLVVTCATSHNMLRLASIWRFIEAILLVLLLATFACLLFGPSVAAEKLHLRSCLLYPILIWLAYRFNQRGMACVLFLFATIGIWSTIQGFGAFAYTTQTVTERLQSVEGFLLVSTFFGLVLSAMVTEHKEDAANLLESEVRYRSAYTFLRLLCDNVSDMIWAKDLEGRYIFANKAVCRDLLNAVDTNEPIGKVDNFFAERERKNNDDNSEWHTFGEMCQDTDIITIKSGTPQQFDESGNVKGKFLILDVHKVPFMDDNGKIIGTVGSARNVTKTKDIEKRLRESEARLSAAAKAANFGVYSYDFSSGQTYYSHEFLNIYGLPPGSPLELDEDLAPKSLHPDDKTGFLAKMKAANDPCGLGILEHVYRIIRPDGQVRWLRVNGQTTFSGKQPDDRPVHATGVIQDITEGKRLGEEQKQWEQKRQQLQRAESLKTMAGAIAHHFNNQLAVVIGNLEIVIDDIPKNQKNTQILNDAMQGARNAVEVSSLMLTYLGQTTGKHTPLDLSEACRQSLPLLQVAIPKDNVLINDLPIPGPIINANLTQLQQALTNLVTNAWEAAGKNPSTIHLTVKTVSPADIPESQRFPLEWQPRDMTYACLEIKDSSGGIAEENIEKLFDPFFSSKFPGRGLGLPVALGIVNAHGGAITVKSEVGQGCTFQVYIPISGKEALLQSNNAVPRMAMGRIGKVLLVEDEEIVSKMTQTMLTRMGFKVVIARDGIEAVEIFQQHLNEIAIVLTDLSMPRMDGWETISALRRIRPDIPFILTTGHNDSLLKAGDHSEQPQVFLSKPYQKAALKEALARAAAFPLNQKIESNSPSSSTGSLQ